MNFLKTFGKPLLCTALTALVIAIPNYAKAEGITPSANESVLTNSVQVNATYQEKLNTAKGKVQRLEILANKKLLAAVFIDNEYLNFEKEILDDISTLNDTDKKELKTKVEEIRAMLEAVQEKYRIRKYNKSLGIVTGQIDDYSDAAWLRMINREILNHAREKGEKVDNNLLNRLEDSDKKALLDKLSKIETRLNNAEIDITDVENEIGKYEQESGEVYIIGKNTRAGKNITNIVLQKEPGQIENTQVNKEVVSITDKNTTNPFITTKPGDNSELILARDNNYIRTDKVQTGTIPFTPIPIYSHGSDEEITVQFSKNEACMDTKIDVMVQYEYDIPWVE